MSTLSIAKQFTGKTAARATMTRAQRRYADCDNLATVANALPLCPFPANYWEALNAQQATEPMASDVLRRASDRMIHMEQFITTWASKGKINMKNTLKNLLILSVLTLVASMSLGQTILPHTTLSAAVTTSSATTISLTSTTGVVAGSTVLFVADGEGEAMFVNSVPSSGIVGVTRGYQSIGKARAHLSGALVFVAQGNAVDTVNVVPPTGSCTRTNIPYLPVISLGMVGSPSAISDCVGGVWVNGYTTAQGNTPFRIPQPETGAVLTTGINTNGTTLAATTMYCTELDLPFNKLVTGLGVLNGTTVGTDNHLVALYDSTGNLIANSAVAGALAASASTYQAIAFTTSYYLVGPAQYFGCLQTNGTTATVRMLITNVQDQRLTKGVTAQTFGTIPATITVPTTFTTAVGPYYEFY